MIRVGIVVMMFVMHLEGWEEERRKDRAVRLYSLRYESIVLLDEGLNFCLLTAIPRARSGSF